MWQVFLDLALSMGVTVELIVTFVILLGSLIFFAVGFQKGLIALLLLFTAEFSWFYQSGLNYALPATLLLMVAALMALSIYLSQRVAGGIY